MRTQNRNHATPLRTLGNARLFRHRGRILPELQKLTSTEASIKQELVVLLGESLAEAAFGRLKKSRLLVDLKNLQDDIGRKTNTNSESKDTILRCAKEATQAVWERLRTYKTAPSSIPTTEQPARPQAQEFTLTVRNKKQRAELLEVADACLDENELGEAVQSEDAPPILVSIVSTACLRVLKRKKVRRVIVYEKFVRQWIEHGANKAQTQGAVSPDEVRIEAHEYAQNLALQMTEESITKIVDSVDSKLFRESSVFDRYLANDGLTKAARAAAPIKQSSGILSFIQYVDARQRNARPRVTSLTCARVCALQQNDSRIRSGVGSAAGA